MRTITDKNRDLGCGQVPYLYAWPKSVILRMSSRLQRLLCTTASAMFVYPDPGSKKDEAHCDFERVGERRYRCQRSRVCAKLVQGLSTKSATNENFPDVSTVIRCIVIQA